MTDRHQLSARDVTLAYGERTVTDGLDLDVAPGRVTVIVGANGCGKSTLLRALARLLAPRSGQVVLDGTPADLLAAPAVVREWLEV